MSIACREFTAELRLDNISYYSLNLSDFLQFPARLLLLCGCWIPPLLRPPLLPPGIEEHGAVPVLLEPCIDQDWRDTLLVDPAVGFAVGLPASYQH